MIKTRAAITREDLRRWKPWHVSEPELDILFDRPMKPLEVLTRKDGDWAEVPCDFRFWVMKQTAVLSDGVALRMACECEMRPCVPLSHQRREALQVARLFADHKATLDDLKAAYHRVDEAAGCANDALCRASWRTVYHYSDDSAAEYQWLVDQLTWMLQNEDNSSAAPPPQNDLPAVTTPAKERLLATKPPSVISLFHRIIEPVRDIAREHGYAIGVHGSLARDIDLIAVPWIKPCSSPAMMARAVWETVRATLSLPEPSPMQQAVWDSSSSKPVGDHGRHWRAIYLDDDCQGPYIDLSIYSPAKAW